MSRELLSSSAGDYLKQLYLLSQTALVKTGSAKVNTQALADALNVTPASATGMLRKLTDLGFVHHAAYQGATLTPQGEALALELLRHHRLLELFLHRALGYALDEVHAEAEQLEHVISETFEARMAEWLGHPTHDPHGDPIPALDGSLPRRDELHLSAAPVGSAAVIVRVPGQDPAQLRSLVASGLVPGANISVLHHHPAFGTLTIQLGSETRTLALSVADLVYVTLPVSQPEPQG
ncbi:metal-dependent transcriptional regulator [Deinococcus ruber]|uniref:Manganese transport regulator n=1 Tax=Deinococcus ruber TaxID=1848197 RepID=A0A918CK33_9DEIO|nr:metal-dependent transcriptional regulator [Deinococcus ruber]GGR27233.1 DNA-binding protein [Deinococcus ruber]